MIDIFVESGKLVALITCPICKNPQRATDGRTDGSFLPKFPMSNFKRHIRLHEKKITTAEPKKIYKLGNYAS